MENNFTYIYIYICKTFPVVCLKYDSSYCRVLELRDSSSAGGGSQTAKLKVLGLIPLSPKSQEEQVERDSSYEARIKQFS